LAKSFQSVRTARNRVTYVMLTQAGVYVPRIRRGSIVRDAERIRGGMTPFKDARWIWFISYFLWQW